MEGKGMRWVWVALDNSYDLEHDEALIGVYDTCDIAVEAICQGIRENFDDAPIHVQFHYLGGSHSERTGADVAAWGYDNVSGTVMRMELKG